VQYHTHESAWLPLMWSWRVIECGT
jgi:hypothetical protein